MLKVHVHPPTLRRNVDRNEKLPPIVCEAPSGTHYGFQLEHPLFRIVTSDDGAHVWVETDEPVQLDGKPIAP